MAPISNVTLKRSAYRTLEPSIALLSAVQKTPRAQTITNATSVKARASSPNLVMPQTSVPMDSSAYKMGASTAPPIATLREDVPWVSLVTPRPTSASSPTPQAVDRTTIAEKDWFVSTTVESTARAIAMPKAHVLRATHANKTATSVSETTMMARRPRVAAFESNPNQAMAHCGFCPASSPDLP